MQEAARITDEIGHSAALGDMITGMGIGAVVGAVLGAVAIAAAVAVVTVATGGAALPLLFVAGAVLFEAGSIGMGVVAGARIGKIIGQHNVTACGCIVEGIPSIHVGSDHHVAAFCGANVNCDKDKHDGPFEQIAEGSATVLLGPAKRPAARVGDKGTCGFVIMGGWGSVIIGGPTTTCGLTVGSEVPAWLDDAIDKLGWVSAGLMLVGGAMMLAPAVGWATAIARTVAGGVLSVGLGVVGKVGGGLVGDVVDHVTGRTDGYYHDLLGEIGQDTLPILGARGVGKVTERINLGGAPTPPAIPPAAMPRVPKGQLGSNGEAAVIAELQARGYTNVQQIQNNSGHGIDVVATNRQGQLRFFEVKSTQSGSPNSLSAAQRNMGADGYVRSRLNQAVNARGQWASAPPGTQQSARNVLTQLGTSQAQGVKVDVLYPQPGQPQGPPIIRYSRWR